MNFCKSWLSEELGRTKKERDFDLDDANAVPGHPGWHRGTMVSGSSDCSVIVWDLYSYLSTEDGNEEFKTTAEIRGTLRGHTGGVLDLRIESKWIISWCVALRVCVLCAG